MKAKIDLIKYDEKLTSGYFWVIVAIIIVMLNYKVSLGEPIYDLSIGFITFPILFLGIYAIRSIRINIKTLYKDTIKKINSEISTLKNAEEGEKDTKKLIEMDRKILELREKIPNFENKRLTKYILFSFLLLLGSIFSYILNLGFILKFNNEVLVFILFGWSLYYILKSLIDILISLN